MKDYRGLLNAVRVKIAETNDGTAISQFGSLVLAVEWLTEIVEGLVHDQEQIKQATYHANNVAICLANGIIPD